MRSESSEQRCLVIGAGGGIGRALLPLLARAGWELILAGRKEEPLRVAAGDTGSAIEPLDATDFDAVASVFEKHPGITGAVNLAGSILLKPAHLTSAAEFEQTVAQNLRTAFSLVSAAGQRMRSSGGSVVLMSTCAASVGLANHEAIAAAKGGVEGLVRAAAATYAPNGIRFNAVAPGLVNTPLAEWITGNETARRASEAMHPLGRIGEPGEIARMIAFLLDPDSAWITGQTFGVDGGLSRVRSREKAGA